MPAKPLKKIRSNDADLMRVQDAIAEVLEPLTKAFMLDARILRDVAIGTSPTAVDHGLGREPLGWMLVDKTAAADVWRSTTTSIAPKKLLMLVASAPITATLIVF